MSHLPRRLAFLASTSILAASLVACSAAGTPSTPPSAASSDAPSGAPSADPSSTPVGGGIQHKTGATDVLLRYDECCGFTMAGFAAAQVPHFTLYGDGTVIFRDPMLEGPAAQGSTISFNPMRTAKLSEEQIQELLVLALGEGGLAAARANYENTMITDVTTTLFTIDAGEISKKVSIYALGLDGAPPADAAARAAFKKFADRLADFDQGGTIATEVYKPAAYRASLLESPGMNAPDLRDWPWDELTVADFEANADPNGLSFPHRTMTADEVAELGIAPYEGGFVGLPLRGTDDKLYTLSLRPLLPDEDATA